MQRSSEPLSLLMIDVDRFKAINDEAGHLEGDRVLKSIADALTSTVRGSDTVCRFGGEEFAIILEQTSLSQAVALATRIQATIARTCTWFGDDQRLRAVTVTIGIAASHEASTPEALVRLADGRLYAGKRSSRNCVVAADLAALGAS